MSEPSFYGFAVVEGRMSVVWRAEALGVPIRTVQAHLNGVPTVLLPLEDVDRLILASIANHLKRAAQVFDEALAAKLGVKLQ